jgi:RNA polymerase sigma-70 factor, ECF subfamily
MMITKSEGEQAFEHEALAHTKMLHRYGVRLTGNSSDADDLVQETYLKAYRFWETYDQGSNVRAWLFKILKNSFINSYRKGLQVPKMVDYNEVTMPISTFRVETDANNRQDSLYLNHFDDEVSGAVSELPDDYRTVIILCDIEGLTYLEIARFVECPIGTVRSRLHRGRKMLHAKLYDYARENGFMQVGQPSGEDLQFADVN